MPFMAALILFSVTAICVVAPGWMRDVAGRRPLGVPTAPNVLDRRTGEGAGSFFADRNVVVVRVAEDINLKRFLEVNRMDLEGVREDIAAQLGVAPATLDARTLRAGQEIRIRLTPTERER